MVICVEKSEEQLRCAYRKYYIVCILITVPRSKFCADIAQNSLDVLSRLSKRTVNGLATNYTYKDIEGNQTTTLVESINTGGISYVYDYDKVNNIKSVTVGNKKTTYEYDELNQLTRVNDPFENVTHVYTYNNGNIVYDLVYEYSVGVLPSYPLSATQYLYENATWSDILTGVKKSHFDNGVEIIDDRYSISSDTIGNITNLNGPKYSWLGRQLQSVSNSDNSKTTYSYNADGQRIAKAVNSANGDEYNYRYYYNGDILAGYKLVITKSDGLSTTHNVAFMYDENGEAFGFNYNGNDYYYVRNAQNDVVRIVDSANETVVSYQYDSWGKLLSCEDTSENDIVSFINPYTYRGYYYDSDTEMYFLKSRYYNPELHRFISADSVVFELGSSIIGCNLYTYCLNNPIKMADTNGNLPFFIVTATIGSIAGAIVGGVVAAKQGKSVLAGVGLGAAVGGLVGAGLGAVAGALLAGSVTATTGAVIAGGHTLGAAISSGGISAGINFIANNLSNAANHAPNAAQTVGNKMREVVVKGKNGETLSGITKNTIHIPSLSGTASYRIPDGLDDNFRILSEVKNYAGTLSYTRQINDFVMWSQANGYQMHLYTNATLTAPLQQAVDSGLIQVFPLG